MSLLLDALKKAAEQKAEKSKETSSQSTSADETLLESAAEDISELSQDVPQQREPQDETQLEHSELDTRLERNQVSRADADETGLDIRDDTESEDVGLSEQMQTGEDETIIFAQEDVSDFLGEEQYVGREQPDPADETDLSQIVEAADLSDLGEAAGDAKPREDETDLSEYSAGVDETDLSRLVVPGDPPSDDTDLSQLGPVTDDTDLSRLRADSDDTSTSQIDDMSLLLVEGENTGNTGRTSLTDPQTPGDQAQALEDDGGLGLVDITRIQAPPADADADETATDAGATQTSTTGGVPLGSLTTEATTTRADLTSTRTYAPDNYDRTLMRLPSDDASKLFAGMKSDSDVVMTPDHAKKVFKSKSSAQRLQHYKFYGGIAIVILLAIGIFGLFEMQEESSIIDSNLLPLKHDPMPGIIKSVEEASGSLFAEAGVDRQTLEIVENAQNPEQTIAVTDSVEETVEDEAVAEPEPELVTETLIEVAMVEAEEPVESESSGVIASAEATAPAESQSSDSTLQITSSARITEKDNLLQQAYAAYQSGNDDVAMMKYNQVLEIDPGNRNALLARAAINIQNDNSAQAIRDYQSLLLANPKDSLAMTSMISVANYSPVETESQLKLMIRDEPRSPYLNFALANSYGAQGRWQEAQAYYFTALENNPGDPNYAYNLAVSLEHISKPKVAISYYQRALDNFGNGLATFNRDLVDQRLEMLGKL